MSGLDAQRSFGVNISYWLNDSETRYARPPQDQFFQRKNFSEKKLEREMGIPPLARGLRRPAKSLPAKGLFLLFVGAIWLRFPSPT
jgi:hypothetical protein